MAEEEKVQAQAEPSEFRHHIKAAGRAVLKQWGSLIPHEFWQYGKEARREMLLAVRSVVDGAIVRLEGEAKEAPVKRTTTRRKTKVEVE